MQAVTSTKKLAIWPVILGFLILVMVIAIATASDQTTGDDGLAVPAPVTVTFAFPRIEDGPVPGMPRDTFEAITGPGQGIERPMGMPEDTWHEING
jgi:hypothetical protein